MKFLGAAAAGVLFGSGLLVSGMVDPSLVLSFLDVGGDWNPTLAFVMAGAILVAAPAFFLTRRRGATQAVRPSQRSASEVIDPPLVIGAAIFGTGWGLTGVCPGPGLVLLSGPGLDAVTFVSSMVAGMLLSSYLRPRAAGIDARGAPASVAD